MDQQSTCIVYCARSLDGFIARPDGGIDWLMDGIEGEDYGWSEFFPGIDALVMGRATFDVLVQFDAWHYGETPVFVLSNSLQEVPERFRGKIEIFSLQPHEVVRELASRGLHRLYIDGGRVIQDFLKEDLIDEMILTTVPILIGEGIPLFGPIGADLRFEYLSSKAFPDGLLKSHYRRKR